MSREQAYYEMMDQDWRANVRPERVPILEERIRVTTSCRDCDDLPRDTRAGACFLDQDGNAVQVMHNGLKVLYGRYYGKWMNDIIAKLGGVHEPQEERVFYEVLKHIPANASMLEAGCYWGYYSMWFAQQVAGARPYLVEPHPLQMRVARRNFELNCLTGDFTLGYFGGYPEHKLKIQAQRVGDLPRFTVPEFMDQKGLARITILHSDIQGYEEDMLSGAQELLDDRRIDWIFVSTHGKRHLPCRDILTNAGYRMIAEHDLSESASMDGLLVAQNPDLPQIPKIEISLVDGLVKRHGNR